MSQNAKVEIEWKGKQMEKLVQRELASAVEMCALLVMKTTTLALTPAGQTAVNKTGLNKGKDVALKIVKGKARINDLKTLGKNILHGGNLDGVDRIYWNQTEQKWTQSSPPGSPPYKQSGALRRSIGVQYGPLGLTAKVGPRDKLVYGRIQELGGKTKRSTLPPRPYLTPSFEACIPQMEKILAYAIAKAGAKL